MARLALSVGGAVAGFIVGGPAGAQVGWMAGSIAGTLIPQNTRGPSIEEAATQTTAEGAPRAIVYGTAMVSGNVIDAGKTRKIDRKQSQGKGGQSVTTEALLRTYAIRICEGPIAGVLVAKKDGKIVYDIRPGSNFGEDNAKFLAGCRIYLGDEDQLPDPDLEAIRGVGEVPAHRGSAYIVFIDDDVTDRRGSVPQYEFVVTQSATPAGDPDVSGLTLESRNTYLNLSGSGYPYAITHRDMGFGTQDQVIEGGSYDVTTWREGDFTKPQINSWTNAGDGWFDKRMFVLAATDSGVAICYGANGNALNIFKSGYLTGYYVPWPGEKLGWMGEEGELAPVRKGGNIWISGSDWYICSKRPDFIDPSDNGHILCKFTFADGTRDVPVVAAAYVHEPGVFGDMSIHLSRGGKIRKLTDAAQISRYSSGLIFEGLEPIPPGLASGSNTFAFGVDEQRDLFATLTFQSASVALFCVFRHSTLALLYSTTLAGPQDNVSRIVFGDDVIYVQYGLRVYKIQDQGTIGGGDLLSNIVADIHARCDIPASDYDVSELTDSVDGLVLASAGYSGADAIGTLRVPYFFDRAEWGGKMRYPKRGKPTVATITLDDLVEEPDESERQAQIEYPRKYHLTYQSAAVNYEAAQATSDSSSPDVRVTGESALQVPVVLTPARAAEIAAILHKVSRTKAEGEIKFSLPDSWLRLVTSDCVALNLRGTSRRVQIDSIEMAAGIMHLTTSVDRRSAYASTTGYVPLPDPTPPVSSVVGETVLAVLDVPALRDDDDALYYYAAVTGDRPAWRGAQLQRSLDGGASYANALDINFPATLGQLVEALPAASPWYTDRTNSVVVDLVRDGDSFDDITDAAFLARGGALGIKFADGSWEVAQYRDAEHISGRRWRLSTLHRGQLNTPSGEHSVGAQVVLLDDVSRVSAQSAWLQSVLTHRAPSFGGSVESAPTQDMLYAGRAQLEWPVTSLLAAVDAGTLSASWAPRHRFGSDVAPLASLNFQGFRVQISDGTTTLEFDTTDTVITRDVSAMSLPITLSVAALNRITGPGPATTRTITA